MTKFCLYLPERSYSAMEKGIVFSIEEFAIHDGPGIRTTVFLKGCQFVFFGGYDVQFEVTFSPVSVADKITMLFEIGYCGIFSCFP